MLYQPGPMSWMEPFSVGLGLGSNGKNVPAPTVISATVSANGITFTVVFSEAVNITNATGITFTDSTQSTTPSVTYSSGTGTATIVFSLGTATFLGDTCTWSYNSATGNIVASGTGNAPLATFSNAAVTNGSTVPVPIAVRGTPTTGTLTTATAVPLPTFSIGDCLVVVIYCTKASPPGTPTGWIAQTPQTGTTAGMYTFYKTAVDSDTFVSTSSIALGCYNAYALKNFHQIDTQVGLGGTTTPISANTGSASFNPDVLISCFGADGITPVISAPSGGITATAQTTNTSVALVTGYETLVASGAWTARTAAVSGQSEWEGVSAAFN